MSTAPPPPGVPGTPYGQPAVPPSRPQKYRPSGWWFALGTGLIVVAIGIAVGVFVWLVVAFLDFDAIVDADGQPHNITVGTDRDRMLWTDSTAQECRVIDRESGEPIVLHRVSGDFQRTDDNGEFEGFLSFAPGSGDLQITCDQTDGGPPGSVLVSAKPRIGSFVVGLLFAVGVPGLLGLLGLAIIIVNGILWSTRLPRPKGT